MDIESVNVQIKNAQAVIQSKKEFIESSRQEMAEYLCPFSVGEKVVNPEGETEIVAAVYSKTGGLMYGFTVYKIKVNGEPYINSCDAWYADRYTKLK